MSLLQTTLANELTHQKLIKHIPKYATSLSSCIPDTPVVLSSLCSSLSRVIMHRPLVVREGPPLPATVWPTTSLSWGVDEVVVDPGPLPVCWAGLCRPPSTALELGLTVPQAPPVCRRDDQFWGRPGFPKAYSSSRRGRGRPGVVINLLFAYPCTWAFENLMWLC
jgi:hypothetical protein